MRIAEFLLLFTTYHVRGWEAIPHQIFIDENTASDVAGPLITLSSDKPSVKKYKFTGPKEEYAPFELREPPEDENICKKDQKCVQIWLKREFEFGGASRTTLDREEKAQYTNFHGKQFTVHLICLFCIPCAIFAPFFCIFVFFGIFAVFWDLCFFGNFAFIAFLPFLSFLEFLPFLAFLPFLTFLAFLPFLRFSMYFNLYCLVVALDQNGVEKERTNTIVIAVKDDNDERPNFTPASASISCDENLGMNEICGQVTATDEDEGNYGRVSYSLKGTDELWYANDGSQTPRNTGLFKIRTAGDQGEIYFSKNSKDEQFDREIYERVEITVIATDNPGRLSNTGPVEQVVTIFLNDVNDQDVEVELPKGFSGSISVSELANPGQIGDYFAATDKDIDGVNNEVYFEISQPADSPFSTINEGNIIIRVLV